MNVIKKTVVSTLTMISPKLNTRFIYRLKFKKKLDLNNPITLNDKILWLKFNTYWNNPLIKKCADKYRVREYIEEIGCKEILNELIGVYENKKDIPWSSLPNSFALKLNTGCACNFICSDKDKLKISEIEKTIHKWMKSNYYLAYSEMQYKDVKKYILIEKYLGDSEGNLPLDYKFYCFNGKSEYVMVCSERVIGKTAKFYYFDRNWNMMPFTKDALENPNVIIPKPEKIDEAFAYADRLASEFPFVRVDLYIVNGNIYFGELTFTPSAGMDNERLKITDEILGNMLQI